MNRKKIIVILCIAAVVIAASVAAAVFLLRGKPADIRDTPIPQHIDIASASQPTMLAQASFPADKAEQSQDADSARLFGKHYAATVYTTDDASGAMRKTEYLADDGSVAYTALHYGDEMTVYNADGLILYNSGANTVEADYLTEPVHWFYRGGKLACGELCFYDGDNTGVAYYNADGALLCIRTEVFSSDEKGDLQVSNVWYDSQFEPITEEAFRAAVPQTDEDAFLYIEWA